MITSLLAPIAVAADLTFLERHAPQRISGLYADTPAELRAQDLVYDRLFYRSAIS